MTEATPGPWLVDDEGDVCTAYGAGLLIACPCYDADVLPIEEARANARQLAAVPDLLAALEMARTHVEFALNQGMADDQDLAAIDAALAKARGHE